MSSRYDIVHITEVASTQDEAADRFDRSDDDVLVVADRQTDGRGRDGRSWSQPDRALYSSFAYDSDWDPEHRGLIPLVAAVAVAEAVEAEFPTAISLKWPNDLMRRDADGEEYRKVGGLLVEASGDRVIVGCGINLWWTKPIDGATGVSDSDPGPTVARGVAESWVNGFLELVARGPGNWPRDRYLRRSVTVGSHVVWDGGSGMATGIGEDGSLVVKTSDGATRIHAGDVHLHGPH